MWKRRYAVSGFFLTRSQRGNSFAGSFDIFQHPDLTIPACFNPFFFHPRPSDFFYSGNELKIKEKSCVSNISLPLFLP